MSTNIIRIKRRLAADGAAVPSTSQLVNAELAFSEADQVLYYGLGGDETGADDVIVIGGKGAYIDKTTAQSVSGVKTFSDGVRVTATPSVSTDVINKGYLEEQLQNAGGSVTLTQELTADVELGGITAGEVLSAQTTLLEFAEKLLFKTYNPSYTAPSLNLTSDLPSVVEAGTTGVNFTASFNRGSINGQKVSGVWQSGASQGFRSGDANNYTIDGVDRDADNTYNDEEQVIADGSNSFSATVDYDQGPQPLNSKGENYQSPLAAGSVSDSLVITGKRKSFWKISSSSISIADSADIRALSNSDFKDNGGSITLSMPAGTKEVVFAFPASFGDVTSVKYVEGLNAEVKSTFTVTTVSVEGANGYQAVNYKVYKKVFPNALAATNTYSVTI